MRFDDRLLDEIKSRLRLSDVIGRSVKLRRSGREWVGLSPFAKEKSPSFYVNDEKGFFHVALEEARGFKSKSEALGCSQASIGFLTAVAFFIL
jgi:hypothetical protein